jgi:hypothetical protein
MSWKYCFVSTTSCLRKVFSKRVFWNCPEGLALQVRFLASTLWFRRLATVGWAPSGWLNETTGGLSGA